MELVRDVGDCRGDNGLVTSVSIITYYSRRGIGVTHHIQGGQKNTEDKGDDNEGQAGALRIFARILCRRLDGSFSLLMLALPVSSIGLRHSFSGSRDELAMLLMPGRPTSSRVRFEEVIDCMILLFRPVMFCLFIRTAWTQDKCHGNQMA